MRLLGFGSAEGFFFLLRKTRLLAAKLGKQQAADFLLGKRVQRNRQQGSPRPLWLLCAHPKSQRITGIDTCWGKTRCESPLLGVCAAGEPE